MNETDMLLQDAERDVERVRQELTRSAFRLCETMARLGERLETEGPNDGR